MLPNDVLSTEKRILSYLDNHLVIIKGTSITLNSPIALRTRTNSCNSIINRPVTQEEEAQFSTSPFGQNYIDLEELTHLIPTSMETMISMHKTSHVALQQEGHSVNQM